MLPALGLQPHKTEDSSKIPVGVISGKPNNSHHPIKGSSGNLISFIYPVLLMMLNDLQQVAGDSVYHIDSLPTNDKRQLHLEGFKRCPQQGHLPPNMAVEGVKELCKYINLKLVLSRPD
jgi:hypothetical protein